MHPPSEAAQLGNILGGAPGGGAGAEGGEHLYEFDNIKFCMGPRSSLALAPPSGALGLRGVRGHCRGRLERQNEA